MSAAAAPATPTVGSSPEGSDAEDEGEEDVMLRASRPPQQQQQQQTPSSTAAQSRRWSTSSTTMPELVEQTRARAKTTAARFRAWLGSPAGRQVLKCTIAYTIASLATFVPFLARFLGKPDGKHVVATITVYFHPARTAGSMFEAVMIAVVAVAYAELVSVLSMATSVLFGSVLHMVTAAHLLVVVVFIGGGFGFMGWVKQRMGSQLVNTGSTLASLAIIGVVTRENHVVSNVFSNEKVSQVLKMLVMGITSTAAVNLLIWRQSARQVVRDSLGRVSVSLADMLSMIVDGFSSGSGSDLASEKFTAASSGYQVAYTTMMRDLREAKFEHYFLGNEAIYYNERSVAGAMEMLAQSLGGLKNAANTQLSLLSGLHSAPQSPTAETPPSTHLELFDLFTEAIGPAMKALGDVLCQVFNETPFKGAPDFDVNTNPDLRQDLANAINTFNTARTEALRELYTRIELIGPVTEATRISSEEVAAACGHFSFSLQAVGEEVLKYFETLENLDYVTRHRRRSWRWLMFWRSRDAAESTPLWAPDTDSPEADALIQPMRRLANAPDIFSLASRRNSRALESPRSAKEIPAWILRKFLRLFKAMARDDIKFGLKVGIGASLWAMFAFLDATRDTYTRWRGEWGLLSFMIVCSMTVGASNTTGWSRFVGTVIGCTFSVINWTISMGYALLLIPLGWAFSFLIFYFVVVWGQGPLGRITLLAYNVSTLYAYSISQRANTNKDDTEEIGEDPDIVEITKHRAIAVTAGILWGLIVCRIIWPISGRRKFKEGLAMLHLQMGLVWKRGPLSVLFRSQGAQSYLKSGEQAAMQRYAADLEGLRQSAASEFDLTGPFPMDAYGRMMRGTNRILDGFYAMSLVAFRKGDLTDAEKVLLQYTARERAALCDNICHAFEVLASSAMLEYPLTDATPSIFAAREHLLRKVFQFRKDYMAGFIVDEETGSSRLVDVMVEERDYALFYAYALVTGQVAEELRMLNRELDRLLGVSEAPRSLHR